MGLRRFRNSEGLAHANAPHPATAAVGLEPAKSRTKSVAQTVAEFTDSLKIKFTFHRPQFSSENLHGLKAFATVAAAGGADRRTRVRRARPPRGGGRVPRRAAGVRGGGARDGPDGAPARAAVHARRDELPGAERKQHPVAGRLLVREVAAGARKGRRGADRARGAPGEPSGRRGALPLRRRRVRARGARPAKAEPLYRRARRRRARRRSRYPARPTG